MTGRRDIPRRRHTLSWIPMQYGSDLMQALSALAALDELGAGSSSSLRPR